MKRVTAVKVLSPEVAKEATFRAGADSALRLPARSALPRVKRRLQEAYASRNVAPAAVTTLAVNFMLCSLLFITLPSVVVPGLGLQVALFRALLWALLLAPTNQALAWAMLPHLGTLLLEGEGYILAAFFRAGATGGPWSSI
jgi:hypothetical protein